MLAKKYRLPVQSVLSKKSLTLRGRYFSIKVFASTLSYSRVGVIISAKVAPKATMRNALRRIIYTAVPAEIATKPVRDYLFIFHPGAYQTATADAIIKELKALL